MAGIETILADFEKLKTSCEKMKDTKILVGIVGTSDSDDLKISHAHEYGTATLPERSFIRASFDADKNKIGDMVSAEVAKVLSGEKDVDSAANSIGAHAAQSIQSYIDENKVKPPSDFSKKIQHTTLYETGTHIRDRIAFEVVKK